MHVSIFARLLTCFLLGLSGLAGCSKTDPLQPPAADGSVSADRSVSGDGSVSADGSEPTLEKVTKALSSNMSGELSLPNGAKIAIPLWGIPVGPQGGAAIEFSLARSKGGVAAPTGETVASDTYTLSPGHFTFARPIEVTLPIVGDPKPDEVRVYRVNPSTKKLERYSARYDPATKLAIVQTYGFSTWFGTTRANPSADASGAFKITNTTSDHWINVCVTARELTFKGQESDFPSTPVAAAPSGTTGWSSSINWYLPQGKYTLCVESQESGTPTKLPGKPVHIIVPDQILDQPWTHSAPKTKDLSYGSLPGAVAGPCDCTPKATAAEHVFDNGNVGGVYNQPTTPTVFTTDRCYFISRVVTYHWNGGAGKTPGTVALKSSDGTTYGPWQASGTPGQGGVVNAYWNCYPSMVLPKGTYTFVDSDPSTWAQNSETKGAGMAWVEGLPTDCPPPPSH
ncbi:MAG: hypothetical protein IT371_14655 [Deltaproteobacteria bacterium]|nr:hypothetical protein [Deltaproteobacteria bacterium]